jgi:hypothetical protein
MSKLTLDEAIKHCLEVADKNEIDSITYKNCKEIKTNMYEKLLAEKVENDCKECAADHKQLAEWLTELKQWRENPFKMIKDICTNQFDCCNCPIGGYCRADDWFGYPSEWEVE